MTTLSAPWWPNGMNDGEAIDALRGLLLAQIKLTQPSATEEREYEHIRSSLMAHPSYAGMMPSLVRSSVSLNQVVAKLRQVGKTYRSRSNFIVEDFSPLLAATVDLERPQSANGDIDRLDLPSDFVNDRDASNSETSLPHLRQPIRAASSKWTGRVTTSEQARLVLALVPTAVDGLEQIIAEEERRRHNLSAELEDAVDRQSLAVLKTLHRELGTLIQLAEAGQPLNQQLETIRVIAAETFSWTKATAKLSLAGAQPLAASAPVALGVWVMLSNLFDASIMQSLGNALVAAIPAGYIGAAGSLRGSANNGAGLDQK